MPQPVCSPIGSGGGARTPHNSLSSDNATPQVIAGLSINPSVLDLGEVWEEKDFRCKIPISNRAAHPIEIPGFAISCRCSMKVEPRQLTIPAGETAEVAVHLDLTHRPHTEIGLAERPLNIDLKPLAKNGQPLARGWQLHGLIKSRLTIDSNHLEFGESAAVGEEPFLRKVRVVAHVPVKKLEIETDRDIVTVRATPVASAVNTFELQISPSTKLAAGAFKTSICVDVITETGDRVAGAHLPVSGMMQPEVRVLPARVLLGSRPVGTTAEAVALLQTSNGAALTIESIQVDSKDLHVDSCEVDGVEKGRAFRVIQRISKEGDQASAVHLNVRKGQRPPIRVTVEVWYRGEAPVATVAGPESIRTRP